jgi:hypothetical protein
MKAIARLLCCLCVFLLVLIESTWAETWPVRPIRRIGSVGHRITGRQPGVVNRHLGIGWEYLHVCIAHSQSL